MCSDLMLNGTEKDCWTQRLLLGVMAQTNLMRKLAIRRYSEIGRDK
jgi:hypothetical protein